MKTDSAELSWVSTRKIDWPAELVAPDAPPVRVTQIIEVVDVFRTKSGKVIIDFGQNVVGRIKVREILAATSVSFNHAEVMEHGKLGRRPLRLAKATDTFTTSSNRPLRDWTPEFAIHGFRYVQINGWPGSDESLPQKENFSALVIHTDMQRRGDFSCSNESLNQLYRNVEWSLRGNFLSVPTDCPQRNERLGWTGDLLIFSPTATFMYDTFGMLSDWLRDLVAIQFEEGRNGIPSLVCPDVPFPPFPDWVFHPAAIWDDIVVLLPYILYQFAADKDLLARMFKSMETWLERGVDRGKDGLWSQDRWQLGDWLDPKAPPEEPANGTTDACLIADAYLVHVTQAFASTCSVLQKTDMASRYSQQASDLKRKFQDKYISPYGFLMSSTQTGISLALQFSLYRNADEVLKARERLNRLVRTARFHIATGFAGTPVITHALTKVGLSQLAYRMLLEKTYPSWLYPVTMGATTIWERWDSMLPDGSINPGQMTSFNHYAPGSIAKWLHTTVGGLSPDTDVGKPGWKTFRVRPVPGGNLNHAEASFDGPYGLVEASWKLEGSKFTLKVTVPPNSSAKVTLPSELKAVPASGEEEPFRTVGSGIHNFSCNFEPGEWPPKPLIAQHIVPPEEFIA
ncbi:alpha-L-rhamnosidase [Xylariaceae sp. FL0662B]|nr:alpha-L-rhamnosidase [Xylariaceae sp. FL0662B]